jgi:ribosomal protein L37AE/L43A
MAEWTDDDYAKLVEESKRRKMALASAVYLPLEEEDREHKQCPDCKRPVANLFDEGIHNTGECGCASSRALCWRSWNGNKCIPLSPYDRSSPP